MEAILLTAALVSLLLVLAASASPGVLALWGRATRRERELEMWDMMRRRGLVADELSASPAEMARAVRRCTLCPSVPVCRRWLASGAGKGTEDFCPNDRFFDALESTPHR